MHANGAPPSPPPPMSGGEGAMSDEARPLPMMRQHVPLLLRSMLPTHIRLTRDDKSTSTAEDAHAASSSDCWRSSCCPNSSERYSNSCLEFVQAKYEVV